MEIQPLFQEQLQPFDDIVAIDAQGRGHRPDGKFMSNYEIEQVGANQDLIRSMAPETVYTGRHRVDTDVSGGTAEQLQRQNGASDLPQLEQSRGNLNAYLPKRWEGLHRAWHKTKELAGKLGDRLAIEHKGYQLTPGENAKARLGRIAMLTKPELGLRDDRNPSVLKAYANRYDTKPRRGEIIKFVGYELLTMPVARSLGVLAIEGATRSIASRRGGKGLPEGKMEKIHTRSVQWLGRYESNTLNLDPAVRAKQRVASRNTPRDPFAR